MNIKNTLYQRCIERVSEQITMARQAMEEAQQTANNESKSSAGDKHETGRAMAHLEKDQHARRLVTALNTQKRLNQLNITTRSEEIQIASLVATNIGHFFIGVSVGSFNIGEINYTTISNDSPLGSALIGLSEEEAIQFRNRQITILAIE